MTAAPLVVSQGVGLLRGGKRILRDMSAAFHPGEIVTIVGPNGSGKTSFLRLLIGAERPSSGRVVRAPGLRIGYVPQRLAFDPTMPITVERFLALAGGARADRAAALARVGTTGLGSRQMSALSGGEFQRVLLAHALLRRPRLLVLDEAAQGLDQPGTAQFYRLIEELRTELGCGVILVGHDLHVVMRASDRVLCLNGHICCEGTPTVVSAAPEYRALFGFGTGGALALYRHDHDHDHDTGDDTGHDTGHDGCAAAETAP